MHQIASQDIPGLRRWLSICCKSALILLAEGRCTSGQRFRKQDQNSENVAFPSWMRLDSRCTSLDGYACCFTAAYLPSLVHTSRVRIDSGIFSLRHRVHIWQPCIGQRELWGRCNPNWVSASPRQVCADLWLRVKKGVVCSSLRHLVKTCPRNVLKVQVASSSPPSLMTIALFHYFHDRRDQGCFRAFEVFSYLLLIGLDHITSQLITLEVMRSLGTSLLGGSWLEILWVAAYPDALQLPDDRHRSTGST